jgi:hypothetical protein
MGRSGAVSRCRWRGTGCIFVGRAGDGARLGELLARSAVVLVHGPAGIGKTELVVRVLEPFVSGFSAHPCRHRDRLLDGELYSVVSRVHWPTLMRRTFGFHVTVARNRGPCHRCPKTARRGRRLAA